MNQGRVLDAGNGLFLVEFGPALVCVLHYDALGFLVFLVMVDPGVKVGRVEDHCDVCEGGLRS